MKTFIFLLTALLPGLLLGQSISCNVIASAGTSQNLSAARISYTIGESVIAQHSNSTFNLGQGFQQPTPGSLTSRANLHEEGEFLVYPNPTRGAVAISFASTSWNTAEIQVLDLNGRLMHNAGMHTGLKARSERIVDISELPAGMYFLMLTNVKKGVRETIKIEKLH